MPDAEAEAVDHRGGDESPRSRSLPGSLQKQMPRPQMCHAIPAADCFDRWYSHVHALSRVVLEARLRSDAEAFGFLGFAGFPAGRIRGLGIGQEPMP